MRFARFVDNGCYVLTDFNNRIKIYSDDTYTMRSYPLSNLSKYIPVPVFDINPLYKDFYKVAFSYPQEPEPTPSQIIQGNNSSDCEKTQNRYLEFGRYYTSDNKIYSFFIDNKGEEQATMLCNFAVGVKNIEQIIDANGNIEAKLHLIIICGDYECEISINPDCTDNLIKSIQKQIPQAYINPLEKRGNHQLSAYISMILESGFPCRQTFKAASRTNLFEGFKHNYIHDGLPSSKSFKDYTNECELVYPNEIGGQLGYWNEIIKQVVKESENLATHHEPYDMYLYAMVNSINSGELKICSNKELYSAYNDSVGFLDTKNKFLYIRAQDAYNQIVRYWDKMGRYFSTTDKTVRKDLVIHNFLLTQSEERKENTTKVVRINNKEQRFLAFDLVKLEKEYGKIISVIDNTFIEN